MANSNYCLRWHNHVPNFVSVFSDLLNNECLVDVTLATEGKYIQAHKVVLSACSSYFKDLFSINPCQHPIVMLKDISFLDLKCVVDFIYYGEVNIAQERLQSILRVAETLNIRGLTGTPSVEIVPNKAFTEKRQGEVSPMCRKKRLKKSPTPSSSTFSSTSIEDLGIEPQYLDVKSEEGTSSAAETPLADTKEGFCYNGFQNTADTAAEKVTTKESCENADPTPPLPVVKSEENIGGISVITGLKKRSRILMRQHHIIPKLDPDGEESSDLEIPSALKRPLERQYSDPTPQPNSTATGVSENRSNLLTVPTLHLIKQNSDSALPPQSNGGESSSTKIDDFIAQTISQSSQSRSIHCPLLRPGPALGCNFCWNTVDNHGRILRRKTKYHCPECRTNLCIVPCFQDFHNKKENPSQEPESSKTNEKDGPPDSNFSAGFVSKNLTSGATKS